MLFGDSLSSRWCQFYAAMTKEFPDATVVPEGIVGASTWDRAALFPRPWPSSRQRPDLVLVLMGVNNYGHDHRHPPEWGWTDLEELRQLAHRSALPVLIGTPLPYGTWNSMRQKPCSRKWSNEYVHTLRRLILTYSQPDVLDFNEAMTPKGADEMVPDCFHPGPAAAQRMAALVRLTICYRKFSPRFSALCDGQALSEAEADQLAQIAHGAVADEALDATVARRAAELPEPSARSKSP